VNDTGDNTVVPVDYKTGNKAGDGFQLDTYGVILEQEYGVEAPYGFFFMSKTGKLTRKHKTADREVVVERFAAMDAAVQAEQFDPKPDPESCRMCDVKTSCSFSLA
jgi:putative RecB family exonuclease